MNRQMLLILFVSTLLTMGLAYYAVETQQNPRSIESRLQPALPAFSQNIDRVAEIHMAREDKSLTLKRNDDGSWTVNSTPANRDKIRKFLIELAKLKFVEAKTEKPERYERLRVEDGDAEKSRTLVLTLKQADGTVLETLLIGRPRFSKADQSIVGFYARRPGEAQAWLTDANFVPSFVTETWQ